MAELQPITAQYSQPPTNQRSPVDLAQHAVPLPLDGVEGGGGRGLAEHDRAYQQPARRLGAGLQLRGLLPAPAAEAVVVFGAGRPPRRGAARRLGFLEAGGPLLAAAAADQGEDLLGLSVQLLPALVRVSQTLVTALAIEVSMKHSSSNSAFSLLSTTASLSAVLRS